jgi:hypothetical protein
MSLVISQKPQTAIPVLLTPQEAAKLPLGG